MNHLDEHLTNAMLDPKYPVSIKAALAIGKKALNQYYDKTDHSEVFRIEMGTFIPLFIFAQSLTSYFSASPSTQTWLL
jgi:hypothetical protein